VIVYALIDPRTRQVRYVGETVRPARIRLSQHLRASREKTVPPVNAWLRGLEAEGAEPELMELECFGSKEAMHDGECYWIEQFRAMGAALLNIAPGGDSRKGYRHSKETRDRWRRERRGPKAGNYGKRRTDEQKAMFAEITRQRWKERPHPMLGTKRSPETIEKMRAARKGRPISPEHRAALAEGSRRRWAEYRKAKEGRA
jgi:hypothetical protein